MAIQNINKIISKITNRISDIRPNHSNTSGLSTYIRTQHNIRTVGLTSSFLFSLLLLTIIIPLYNVTGVEDIMATTTPCTNTGDSSVGTNCSLTFTITRLSASADLTVSSTDGTFASSSSSNNAAFTLSTNNYTGYILTLTGSSSATTLKDNVSNNTLDSISSNTTLTDFSADNATGKANNNKWGIIPSSYKTGNTVTNNNTTTFFPSPSSTNTITMDETTTANSSNAKSYTIGLGVRADYTKTAGTYNNTNSGNTLTLAYVANPSNYSITYNKGNTNDTVSNMPYSSTNNNVSGSVSATSITITDSIPTRTGYDFKGWCTVLPTTTNGVDSCKNSAGTTGTTYNATGATSWTYGIDRTSSNTITLYALWSAKTYTITVNNGGNTTVGGGGTYKYGDTITLTATPTTNTTCATYGTPSWTKTSGEGTLNNTSGTSVTFTVGLGDATITATSTKTDEKQTVTLSRSNATNITIAGTSYGTSTTSVSLDCGTYNITGTFPTGYKFSSWSTANNVTVASTSTLATTMTVSGAGTLTLNGTPNTYSLAITFAGSGVSSVQVRTASGTGGTLMGTVSSSGGSVSGLAYNSTYYLYPVFSSGYEFSSWERTSSYGTLSSTTTSNPTFTMGAGNGAVTITGKSSCSTVTFKTSNASSIVFNGTSYANNQTACVANGTYSIYGTYATKYAWESWSATAGTFGNQSYQNTTYTVTGNATITLTGQSVTLAMQNLSSSNCTTTARPVYDTRDNSVYWVQKLADDKCWMLDNLALDLVANKDVLSSSNTNATDTELGYLKNGGGSKSDKYATSGVISYPSYSYSYSVPWVAVSGNKDGGGTWDVNTTVTSYGSGSGKVGGYYNYCAASAGTYCYGNGTSYGTSSGNATADICPKGWRMPTGGSSGEYNALYTNSAIGSNATNFKNALSTPLSGLFRNGSASYQGSYGYFWSSTRSSNYLMYYLSVDSSNVYPPYNGYRNNGSSVRCVLK